MKKEIILTQFIDAPAHTVFQAWVDPAVITQWFAPSAEMKTLVDHVDLQKGGTYKINMKGPDGSDNIVTGEYTEIIPNKKVSFTWQWTKSSMGIDDEVSTVTIELQEKNGGTELTLTHVGLTDEKAITSHTEGWKGCLARLTGFVQ